MVNGRENDMANHMVNCKQQSPNMVIKPVTGFLRNLAYPTILSFVQFSHRREPRVGKFTVMKQRFIAGAMNSLQLPAMNSIELPLD